MNAFAMHVHRVTLLLLVVRPPATGSRAGACETVGARACKTPNAILGDHLDAVIGGATTGLGAASFAFFNRDPIRRLRHDCYDR